ncbi:EamA-like transporter family protein [compost metagenome]
MHTALAYTLIYAGTLRLPTSRIAIFQFVYPAVAIVIDWLYFRQTLSTAQLIGIAVLTVAISVAERPSRPRPVRQ